MTFGIRCTFSRIRSYAEAAKAWDKGVIFRDVNRTSENYLLVPRGLVDRRKKHMTIEREYETHDIILRLYEHPVVTWHVDNSFTLCGYNTRSTAVFASHCTPDGVYVTSGQFRVTVDGRTYKVGDRLTFHRRDNTWKVKDKSQIEPWVSPVVNRERAARAFQETGYKEFRLWLQVYMQMAAQPTMFNVSYATNKQVIDMLRDRKWRELVTQHYAGRTSDQILRDVREAIHVEYKCIDHKSVPFLG